MKNKNGIYKKTNTEAKFVKVLFLHELWEIQCTKCKKILWHEHR